MIATAVIRPARAEDWSRIESLLSAEGLPTNDISAASAADFIVAVDAGQVVGMVAVERYGRHGLQRSLVVAAAWRGAGLGRALVAAAERAAASSNLESLTLLTQTVAPFSRLLGYRDIARADAQPAVRASAEFTHLCPVSSTCMTKIISRTTNA